VFCRSGNLTKEHIWPDWARKLFDESGISGHNEVHASFMGKSRTLTGSPRHLSRQGSTMTKRIRVVCATCNNTWMSALEGQAKQILMPLITGQEIVLDETQQKLLTEWVVMKCMVAEQNVPNDAVIPYEDRARFKAERAIPRYFEIWITSHISKKWQGAYLRHCATMSRSLSVRPEGKNVSTIALGFGRLFIYVMACRIDGMLLSERIGVHPMVLKLFPRGGKALPIPFMRSLTDADCDHMANSMEMLVQNEKVLWHP
jgi:hypothetical protein